MTDSLRRIVVAGALYFAGAFAAGFAFGTLRTLVLEPRIGAPAAEIAEAPLMIAVVVWLALRLSRRTAAPRGAGEGLGAGLVALALLLAAEGALAPLVRGISYAEQVAARPALVQAASLVSLAVFALAPAAFARLRAP